MFLARMGALLSSRRDHHDLEAGRLRGYRSIWQREGVEAPHILIRLLASPKATAVLAASILVVQIVVLYYTGYLDDVVAELVAEAASHFAKATFISAVALPVLSIFVAHSYREIDVVMHDVEDMMSDAKTDVERTFGEAKREVEKVFGDGLRDIEVKLPRDIKRDVTEVVRFSEEKLAKLEHLISDALSGLETRLKTDIKDAPKEVLQMVSEIREKLFSDFDKAKKEEASIRKDEQKLAKGWR